MQRDDLVPIGDALGPVKSKRTPISGSAPGQSQRQGYRSKLPP